jgi:Uncharacterized enzyme involved in biosynthesis of extracellular polysaccharides
MGVRTVWQDQQAPEPPFWAVLFISQKSADLAGYREMDEEMLATAQRQEGFLGYAFAGSAANSVFVSFWRSEQNIAQWRQHAGHRTAKAMAGRWYRYYHSLICEVRSHREMAALTEANQGQ